MDNFNTFSKGFGLLVIRTSLWTWLVYSYKLSSDWGFAMCTSYITMEQDVEYRIEKRNGSWYVYAS